MPAGEYDVVAGGTTWGAPSSDESFAEARAARIAVTGGAEVHGIDLVLDAGGVLEGSLRLPDGSPPGSAVVLARRGAREPEPLAWCGFGRFRATGLVAGTHELAAASEGWATRGWMPVEVKAGAVQRVELELVPAVRLRLRVLGAPAHDVTVEVSGTDGPRCRAYHDEHGVFRTDPLPFGTYVVRARSGGRAAERTVSITDTHEPPELDLVLE